MRVRALAIRIIRQFLRDRRTLALLLVAPLLVLTLVKLVFGSEEPVLRFGVAHGVPAAIVEALEARGAETVAFDTPAAARDAAAAGELDAVLSIEDGRPALLLEGSDPAASRAVLMLLQQTTSALAPAGAPEAAAMQPAVDYLYGGEEMSGFDNFGPVLIGFFSFFFVFMLAGVSFLRERTGGTLERLLATPIRRSEIVLGYLLGFGLFALVQATLIAWFAISVLDMYMVGSLAYLLLVNLLLTLTALTLGTLLSSFASNEFQIIQFIPLVIVPQVFFSGLFDLDAMADWLRQLGRIMPLYYGADAMRGIMIRGAGWEGIRTDAYALLAFSLLFSLLNAAALRKHRSI